MLSIDITDRQIKLVRGVHSGNKIRVQDADLRELSLGMVSNGYITDVPMVAAEINDIIKTKDIKEKDAIVSITSSSIVYKEMLLAKPKSMKNPAIIEAMIQANMNVSREYNISFTITGETEDEEKNKMLKVIATACPQRLVAVFIGYFLGKILNISRRYRRRVTEAYSPEINFNAGAVNRITHNIKPLTAAYYLIVIINRLSEFLYNIALNLGLIIKKKRRLLHAGIIAFKALQHCSS